MRLSAVSRRVLLAAGAVLALAAAAAPGRAAPVTPESLLNAQKNPGEWVLYGGDYRAQRYSALGEITPANVGQLRPVWTLSTGGKLGGLEATPLYHDGVLYFSADYSRVFAVDARTGTMLWRYEPKYEDGLDAMLCCGPINRGVALLGDKVYVATLDARLVALNAKDGSVAWEQKIDDWKHGVTSETGAPFVMKGHVIIGISGGEYGVRGYLKAYDPETGDAAVDDLYRPGPRRAGQRDLAQGRQLEVPAAARPGSPGAYDAETNTLYWGTGNPGSWAADSVRATICGRTRVLALDPDSGKIKWGYQYTPNDGWDYDGVDTPILVDLTIDGQPDQGADPEQPQRLLLRPRPHEREVHLRHADGRRHQLDERASTRRPAGRRSTRPMKPKSGGPTVEPIVPGLEGGTNWFPPAYNPDLGLAFVADQPVGHGAHRLEEGQAHLQAGRLLPGRGLPDVPERRD